MRKFGFIYFLIATAIVIILAVAYWPTVSSFFEFSPPTVSSNKGYETAMAYLKNDQPKKALKLVHKHRREIEKNTEEGQKWFDLFIDASVALNDGPQLAILYQYRPKAFMDKEEASLLVADALLLTGNVAEYEGLRDKWAGREKRDNSWLVLDSDRLTLLGKRSEAIQLLKSKEFDGSKDTTRLIRLALLNINEQPKQAWEYFTEASKKDPNNPNVRLYRARLLEAVGKPSLALAEYITTTQIVPDNLYFQDQLAEFYLRQKQYPQALSIWETAMKDESVPDALWLKAFFWSRVVQPIDVSWEEEIPAGGKLEPLLDYLAELKKWNFWNEAAYNKVPDAQQYLNTQQATLWLRLFQALKQNDEEQAAQLLQYNQYKEKSWNPELELALKRIINYRKNQTLDLLDSSLGITAKEQRTIEQMPVNSERPSFFAQLNQAANAMRADPDYQLDPQLDALLRSPYVFGAALISAGWFEAALEMQALKVLPQSLPDWVAYGFTEALRRNRGDLEALEFATLQQPSDQLQLLIAELMIAEKSPEAGIEILEKLQSVKGDIGLRAVWLISLVYMDQGEAEKAKEAIENNPDLANSVLGKETLARIALLEGNTATAVTLYESIAGQSSEAKSFLARKAFNEKNWKRARELTISLLKEYPNNPLLRQNLERIEQQLKESP